jgi:hypothetical protein
MKKLTAILFAVLISQVVLASPYGTVSPPPSVAKGYSYTVWNAETPTPGSGGAAASQQIALVVERNVPGTPFSVDGKFSGAPGAFEVDVQVAATDSDTNYQTLNGGNITVVDSTNNTFHLDAIQVNARFARLLMRSRTNSVSITATVTGG